MTTAITENRDHHGRRLRHWPGAFAQTAREDGASSVCNVTPFQQQTPLDNALKTGALRFIQSDLSDTPSLLAALATVRASCKRIDALFNNAGLIADSLQWTSSRRVVLIFTRSGVLCLRDPQFGCRIE